MRLYILDKASRLAYKVELVASVISRWVWCHYWYGPKGAGQQQNPHIAKVPPGSLLEHWRARHGDG